MKQTIILFVFLATSTMLSQRFYYSPGLQVGYTFGEGASIGFKCSLGYFDDGKNKKFNFTNITIGHTYHFNKRVQSHYYSQFQHGRMFNAIIYGASAGYAFFKGNKSIIYAPKLSVFSGLFAYPTIDFIWKDKNPLINLHTEVSLPIVPSYKWRL